MHKPSEESEALKAQLDELRQLAQNLTRESQRVAEASRKAEAHGASAADAIKELRERIASLSAEQGLSPEIEQRLADLTALAEDVSRKAAATRKRQAAIEQTVIEANRLPEGVLPAAVADKQPPSDASRRPRYRGVIAAGIVLAVVAVIAAVRFAGTGDRVETRTATEPAPLPAAPAVDTTARTAPRSAPPARTKPVASSAARSRPAARPRRQPRQFAGTLEILSDPSGAAVYVDRERIGDTPIRLPGLRAGSHVVWIEHHGYQRWTTGVLVPADKLTRLNAKLKSAAVR